MSNYPRHVYCREVCTLFKKHVSNILVTPSHAVNFKKVLPKCSQDLPQICHRLPGIHDSQGIKADSMVICRSKSHYLVASDGSGHDEAKQYQSVEW